MTNHYGPILYQLDSFYPQVQKITEKERIQVRAKCNNYQKNAHKNKRDNDPKCKLYQ